MSQEDVVFNLELNVESANSKIRQIEFLFYRAIGVWNRICRALGVPDDSPIMVVTLQVQKVTMLIRQLHTAMIMLDVASGPIGWAKAGLGISTLLLSTNEFMMDSGS